MSFSGSQYFSRIFYSFAFEFSDWKLIYFYVPFSTFFLKLHFAPKNALFAESRWISEKNLCLLHHKLSFNSRPFLRDALKLFAEKTLCVWFEKFAQGFLCVQKRARKNEIFLHMHVTDHLNPSPQQDVCRSLFT